MEGERIRRHLRRALVECFDDSELRTLCFDLGVDYDSLPGDSKTDRARELVSYFWRRGHLVTLTQVIESLRSDTVYARVLRRFLRESAQTTQQVPALDVLREMSKTGPLGIDYRTVLMMNQKIDRALRLTYLAAGAGVLAFLVALLSLVLR